MQINYAKKFQKAFLKLDKKRQEKVLGTIRFFQVDPLHPALHNHPLKGSLIGERAISITGDMRIIFEEHDGYTFVLMLNVGTHNQVY